MNVTTKTTDPQPMYVFEIKGGDVLKVDGEYAEVFDMAQPALRGVVVPVFVNDAIVNVPFYSFEETVMVY